MFQNQAFPTFGGIPQPAEGRARAAIIPAPLEATVSYGLGTCLGPAALINASCNMELYDEFLDAEPVEHGILTRPRLDVHGTMEDCLGRIERAVGMELDQGRLPVLLGGEHTVSLGAIRALAGRYGNDFTVVVLDAHLDLRDSYQGRKLSHACVMRRAWEMGLKLRQVGVRSCSAKEAGFIKSQGLSPVWARQVHRDPNWLEAVTDGLGGKVYLSLDVDGLDPSIMPATGTPEPGGLDWLQVSDFLQAVLKGRQVLGLDLVELAPINGRPSSDFTAARLLYRAMGLAFEESS